MANVVEDKKKALDAAIAKLEKEEVTYLLNQFRAENRHLLWSLKWQKSQESWRKKQKKH